MYAQWTGSAVTSIAPDLPPNVSAADAASLGWYPVKSEFPDDYVQRFNILLGPPTFTLAGGIVVRSFPESDFSLEKVRAELLHSMKEAVRLSLSKTDWHHIRRLETGAEVPDNVTTMRAETRAYAAQMEREILAEQDAHKLLNYNWTINEDPTRHQNPDGSLWRFGKK